MKKNYQKLVLTLIVGYSSVFIGYIFIFSQMFAVGFPFMVIGTISGFASFILGIWVWIDGARFENMVEMVRDGDEAQALDRLYTAAGMESNNTIIDSDELQTIAKKAKVDLDME